MDEQIAGFALRVRNREFAAGRGEDRAGIADLPARFAIERRLVDDKADLRTALRFGDALPALDEREDHAFGGFGPVAEKCGAAELVPEREPRRLGRGFPRADPGGARALSRLAHLAVEPGRIDAHAVAAQDVLGQIEGEAVGVVENRGDAAIERLSVIREPRTRLAAVITGLVLYEAQPPLQGVLEICFLEPQ